MSLVTPFLLCRGGQIRTDGLLLPKQARYRATLHPDELHGSYFAVRPGFEPGVRLPARQFSKLLVSATHPSHRVIAIKERGCKDNRICDIIGRLL